MIRACQGCLGRRLFPSSGPPHRCGRAASRLQLSLSCPALRELNLVGNPNVTTSALDEVVDKCKGLDSMQLAGCDRISEKAITSKYARFCDIFDEEEEGPWAA
eukprot:TRINITY_DN5851_c0_g2_i1.p4 TRINITY_DN5851_c0_g2~~TRINITY_DN5851_c0_g2_i1.p4  ORF type:complete len:103 (+),score=20.11 TRINITY_DN5851_c0_g2_i1:219-527(+)